MVLHDPATDPKHEKTESEKNRMCTWSLRQSVKPGYTCISAKTPCRPGVNNSKRAGYRSQCSQCQRSTRGWLATETVLRDQGLNKEADQK